MEATRRADGEIRAGISPLDAIRSATINPARAFALSDSICAIRKGMMPISLP